MTYVSNTCGEQYIVLRRNRKQYYGETGYSIMEKQDTVLWGCPLEPEKHGKTRKKTLNKKKSVEILKNNMKNKEKTLGT